MTATTSQAAERAAGRARASSWPVVKAITIRSLVRVRRMPSAFLPSIAMPIFQVIAFSGAFGAAVVLAFEAVGQQIDALDWYVPLAAVQGASFGALGVSFGLIRDLEDGFFDRLLMSPTSRWVHVIGPMFAAFVRALVPVTLVIAVGLIGGMSVPAGLPGLAMVAVAAIGVGVTAAGFALGLTYRMRNMAAATLTQFLIFFTIFLSTSQVPLSFMQGWLHAVARVNPMTNVLRLARQGLLGDVTWDQTWGGLVALGVMLSLATWYARSGLRTFER